MNSFITIMFLVAGMAFVLLLLVLMAANKREVQETEDSTMKEVQDDIRLRDVALANAIRKRAADIPDRLPPADQGGPPTEKRRGRRGPV